MGNCTVALVKKTGLSPTGTCKIVDITLSTSYATGGDTVTLASLGMSGVDALVLTGTSPVSGIALAVVHGAVPSTAPKIKAYQDVTPAATAPLPEVANATNLSTTVVRGIVYGDLPNI